MNTMRIAITAGLFLCIFAFGFWLSHSGKPYNTLIFTIHKLAALGAAIYLAIFIYKTHQAAPLAPALILIFVLAAVCGAASFVTGALLSLNQAMPPFVLKLHQLAPYLTLLSTGALFYLLLARSSPAT